MRTKRTDPYSVSVVGTNAYDAIWSMDTDINVDTVNTDRRRFVKANIPNLSKLEPIGTYYSRCKVNGKLVRETFETKDFTMAKAKLHQWLIHVRGRVSTHKGSMAGLIEEYKRRLRLAVDSRDIRERTMATKIECLTQIKKVWEEIFTTGAINPANYAPGGDQTKRRPAKYLLFLQARLSSLTPAKLEEWCAAMCMAYSPSRVNGAMTVFGELLKLGVKKGMLYRNHDLDTKLGYVRPGKTKLTHLPTTAKFKALVSEIYNRSAKDAAVFGKGLEDSGELCEFLAYSGARIKSANHLAWEDVDWRTNNLTFEVTKRDSYSIPLFTPLKELLERMKNAAGGKPHGKIFKVKSIKRVLSSACKAVDTLLLTHHDLRHLFATRCMENPKIDIPTISRWLGHKDGGALAMKTYGHLRDEHSQRLAKEVRFD